ncbi:hypothetical protein [Dethiothermospora halolimnae]|uniref:hypothetical protein n=1 Tax=Dethiothermospora halolimnae TaxID=3114390 RepID=UPI003CCC1C83
MKKYIVIIFCVILLISGCSSPVKDDLLNYFNSQLPPIMELEEKAIEEYSSIISKEDYKYETLYNSLVKTIIPNYKDFVENLEKIAVETEEVESLNEMYTKGANMQLEAFTLLKEGIKEKNKEKTNKSNELFKEGRKHITKFKKRMVEMADEYNLEYEL